jgi:outer membrane protein TolC
MNGNFGFSFSFSELLDMPSTALRLRQSGASLEDAVISSRDLSIRIEREVKVAIIDLEAAYRNLALANLRVASSRLQVQVADVQLNANLINYFSYQQILDDASAAERDVLTQQLNVLSRRIALDQLLGTTPAFGGTGG